MQRGEKRRKQKEQVTEQGPLGQMDWSTSDGPFLVAATFRSCWLFPKMHQERFALASGFKLIVTDTAAAIEKGSAMGDWHAYA